MVLVKKLLDKKGRKGFTLLELMITIVIIGIIGIMTFAIVDSAMNTFSREKDVLDANIVKDIILTHLSSQLMLCKNIVLTTDNSENGPELTTNEVGRYSLGEDHYLIDDRLLKANMIYSDEGRIYMVGASADGKYYVKSATDALPIDKTDTKMGRVPVFDENIYKGFNVALYFRPIMESESSKFFTLQIILEVLNPKENNITVARSIELVNLLNMESMSKEIDLRAPVIEGMTEEQFEYSYCYYG